MKARMLRRLERLETAASPVADNRDREELARRLDALAERLGNTRDVLDSAPALAYLVDRYGPRP